MSGLIIKAIITTIDNLPNNREQLAILREDPLISQVVFVDQDSRDGTREWLDSFGTSTVHLGTGGEFAIPQPAPARSGNIFILPIHRQNDGAGPGRNAGLDAAGDFDYALMLDGGIRPLHGGTARMLEYLERRPDADGVATDWHFLETDAEKAWRRWPNPITDADVYRNRVLSETHYGLFRRKCFDGFRFADWHPFNHAGWGADDDEMMHRWDDAGVVIHVVQNISPYRRASGSFRRLFEETGIWPDQYGSNYEMRLVWLQQEQPHHGKGMQWGEPWLTVVVVAGGEAETAKIIKRAHDVLRERKFDEPWDWYPNPYSVILWDCEGKLAGWAEPRRLRQHHGDTIILDEYGPGRQIMRRDAENEATWTGDFRVWAGADWRGAIRPGAFYYGLVEDLAGLDRLLARYNSVHPRQAGNYDVPQGRGEL